MQDLNLWRVHKRIWLARSLLTGTNCQVLAFHMFCSEPKCSLLLLVLACFCLCRLHFVVLTLLGQGGVLPITLAFCALEVFEAIEWQASKTDAEIMQFRETFLKGCEDAGKLMWDCGACDKWFADSCDEIRIV